jgi:hypothetical protein
MAEDAEKLFERVEAAISEAKRLVEANQEWQDRAHRTVRRRSLNAVFEPNGRRAVYPQDLRVPPGHISRFRAKTMKPSALGPHH